MKNNIFLILLLVLCSCATVSESGLYWGDYSKTLYEYKKNPSTENLAKHKNELQRILNKSKELKLKAPPGIQAELGSIYMNENNKKEALAYFSSEAQTYPESKVLMTKLTEIINTKKENN